VKPGQALGHREKIEPASFFEVGDLLELEFMIEGFGSLVMRLQGKGFMGWTGLVGSSLAGLPVKVVEHF
jgi:hypothetical protein